jgi:large subunit ribosomal protein L25
MQHEFTAYPRPQQGRGASRRVRRSGKAPGIVYGGSEPPAPIELDHNALVHALKNEAFHASILHMKLDGKVQKVLLRDVQMHPVREQIMHIDFQRVDESRRIHMKVPLHFVNQESSPAVKLGGALITHVKTEIDVSCLPKDLPEFIVVDLSSIESGNSVRASQLALPEGVSVVRTREDPVVATATTPKAAEEEAPAEASAAAAAATPAAAAPAKADKAATPAKADKAPAKKDEKK